MTAPFPARLHVLLARDVPLGVVIRRGPTGNVATLLWNREKDSFVIGQWLKGRIYERRSDLSPDGKYLIYFAMNGKWQSESKGSWSAISRAPFLKAIEFFPKGDCWNGGGLWTSSNSYWLNGMVGYPKANTFIRQDETYRPAEHYGSECTGVYYVRLQRDGWGLVQYRNQVSPRRNEDIFEKPLTSGWTLRKRALCGTNPPEGCGCYWDVHELVSPGGEETIPQPDWEWAEWDGRRLMWASQGRLFASAIRSAGIYAPTELYDFNPMKFQAIEAPY